MVCMYVLNFHLQHQVSVSNFSYIYCMATGGLPLASENLNCWQGKDQDSSYTLKPEPRLATSVGVPEVLAVV